MKFTVKKFFDRTSHEESDRHLFVIKNKVILYLDIKIFYVILTILTLKKNFFFLFYVF